MMPGGLGLTGGIVAVLLALTAKELFWTQVSGYNIQQDRVYTKTVVTSLSVSVRQNP